MKKAIFSAGISLGLSTLATATMVFVPIDITAGTGTTASQTTSHPAGPAGNGIDGNLGNFTHTTGTDTNPTWTADFGRDETFNRIIVHNRDGCCADRLTDITVQAFNSGATSVYNSGPTNVGNALGSPAFITYNLPGGVTARSISVNRLGTATPNAGILSIGELQIGNFIDITIPLGSDLTLAGIAGATVSQGPTSASPPGGGVPGNAIDGNLGNFTHTNANVGVNHFWRIDFGEELFLEDISLLNRSNCCGERLRDITISILDQGGGTVFTSSVLNPGNAEGFSGVNQLGLDLDFTALNGGQPLIGQTVVVTRTPDAVGPTLDDRSVLSLGEVTIHGGTIPEPSTAALLGLALSGLVLRRRR